MDTKSNSFELSFCKSGKRGKVFLVATVAGRTIFSDEVAIIKLDERNRVAEKLCSECPGIDSAAIHERLLELVGDDGDDCDDGPPKSQSAMLVGLMDGAELFHTPGTDGQAYATIPLEGRRETWAINSRGFKSWIRGEFWKIYQRVPSAQAIQDALGVVASKANYDGPEHPVAARIGQHGDAIYLDLGNNDWHSVRITATGWQVVNDSPVKFLRRNGMLPLPTPEAGGAVPDLREFVNVGSDANWSLLATWIVATFRPNYPFPILAVNGEQGSAKSTFCRIVRSLIDPNEAPLRAEPREVGDLMIAAQNAWVLAFDNLSHIPPWLSDSLCRLATGGGFSKRELYSDGEEKLFNAMRPIVLNGIEDLATRSDLLDRCLCLTLPTISDRNRRTEAELWPAFEKARPKLLGAFLDAVSAALRILPTVKLAKMPRMADFAMLGVAAESACGLPSGSFLSAYAGSGEAANELAIEASAVGPLVIAMTDRGDSWNGTAADLLDKLERDARGDMDVRRHPDWPRTAHKLAGQLRRLAPNLRRVGLDVTFSVQRTNRGRLITLQRLAVGTSRSSRQVGLSGDLSDVGDDRSTAASGSGVLTLTASRELGEI